MSVAATTSREVTTSILATGRRRDRSTGSLVFLGLLWFSLFFGVMVLVVLIVDTAIEGSGRFDRDLVYQLRLHRPARERRASAPASSDRCG